MFNGGLMVEEIFINASFLQSPVKYIFILLFNFFSLYRESFNFICNSLKYLPISSILNRRDGDDRY